MANVFVSHRGADSAEAERLAAELRALGHDVWVDVWKIGLCDPIVERIEEGLSGSAYVIVCISKDGVAAPWMSREWMSALARQLNGVAVRLLPARLTGDKTPAILADLKYADLMTDWAAGVAALDAAMR